MPRIDAFALGLQGPRPTMEDRHVLRVEDGIAWGAVFDGHRGSEVAEYAAVTLPAMFDLTPDEALRNLAAGTRSLGAGACAVVFELRGDRLQVANVGDAEIVVVTSDAVDTLTEMHRVTNESERARVVAAGGIIDGPYVVDASTGQGLMPTRTLGDAEFAHVGITGDPYVWSGNFRNGWLIAACDGLWDVVAPAELPGLLMGETDPEQVARRLTDEALRVRNSYDNLTVIALRHAQ
ncbi:MAG: PP2C family protein-serine/threonine phosphatase [Candidatus Dormiibacterota bacterium]